MNVSTLFWLLFAVFWMGRAAAQCPRFVSFDTLDAYGVRREPWGLVWAGDLPGPEARCRADEMPMLERSSGFNTSEIQGLIGLRRWLDRGKMSPRAEEALVAMSVQQVRELIGWIRRTKSPGVAAVIMVYSSANPLDVAFGPVFDAVARSFASLLFVSLDIGHLMMGAFGQDVLDVSELPSVVLVDKERSRMYHGEHGFSSLAKFISRHTQLNPVPAKVHYDQYLDPMPCSSPWTNDPLLILSTFFTIFIFPFRVLQGVHSLHHQIRSTPFFSPTPE